MISGRGRSAILSLFFLFLITSLYVVQSYHDDDDDAPYRYSYLQHRNYTTLTHTDARLVTHCCKDNIMIVLNNVDWDEILFMTMTLAWRVHLNQCHIFVTIHCVVLSFI